MTCSPLQKLRAQYRPPLPELLKELSAVQLVSSDSSLQTDPEIESSFPHLAAQSVVMGKKGTRQQSRLLRVGVVFSGGQAAGGHNVITGLFDALKSLNSQSHVFGFLGGPEGILSCSYQELDAELLASYRNQGGFDLIGSGRTKIETPEQLSLSLKAVQKLELDGLCIIGGDDSNTNAAILAEYFASNGCTTRVIGVPKTIDGDLKNDYVAISFGFDTACKTYAEIIGNIARDALSAKKYYHFIRLMGRSASHIALECALATRPNLTIIGEEVLASKKTLQQITQEIADLICRRAEKGKHFGVIVIPEGLIEFISEVGLLIQELNTLLAKEESVDLASIQQSLTPASQNCFSSLPEMIQKQLLLNRDPHGNVQVSLIETEKLFMETVSAELTSRQRQGKYRGKFNSLNHFLGYEGRAAFPSNFDCTYCYALGLTAALLVDSGYTGYMSFVQGLKEHVARWQIGGVPLSMLMNYEMRKGKRKAVIKKALVNLQGQPFQTLCQHRETWAMSDDYRYPGPIQFMGEEALTDSVPLSL